MDYLESFKKQNQLIQEFREDRAYLSWVMAIYLDRDDVYELATDCLTDCNDDKKIDFIDIDLGTNKITIAQGYYSNSNKNVAPSNKASDLNTAMAWLLSGELNDIPKALRDAITQAREAIVNEEIAIIDILYVHNLTESENCKKELETAAKYLRSQLEDKGIEVNFQELGKSKIEDLYIKRESPILVKEKIIIPCKPFFKETASDWEAYIFSVQGSWLSNLFKCYGDKLFSANYRGFLGAGKRRKINSAIQASAEKEAQNFWVYNNGITILTLGVTAGSHDQTEIEGISIINGAQTTGSIGSLKNNSELAKVKILCRIIKCTNANLIPNIVKANNSQNAITSWDI